MITKNYIRTDYGAVTFISSRNGATLMVNTALNLNSEDWDAAIDRAWDLGQELNIDSPSSVAGHWEFWELHPRDSAA